MNESLILSFIHATIKHTHSKLNNNATARSSRRDNKVILIETRLYCLNVNFSLSLFTVPLLDIISKS